MTDSFNLEAVRARLAAHLKAEKLSQRSVSLKSGHGPGYINAILTSGKEPGVESLARVCAAANASLPYIMYGYRISPEDEALLKLIADHPDKRRHLLALLSD